MRRSLLALSPILFALGACTAGPSPEAGASAAVEADALTPAEVLDRMDSRAPVPLLPMMAQHQKENMRDHLLAVQEIIVALAAEDFDGVEEAAKRIGFSDQMAQMCNHMGAGAPGFTEQALGFHHTADGIGAAARDRDRDRVLTELGATLQTCTACHEAWKQQVVDEATWTELTASPAPMHGAH